MPEDNDHMTQRSSETKREISHERSHLPASGGDDRSTESHQDDMTEVFKPSDDELRADRHRVDSSHSDELSDGAVRRLGKFSLLKTVGSGAFGTVYQAEDTELKRIVAIKVPRRGQFASLDEEERFMREAQSVARLNHPGIVSVYEVGHEESLPFIVSEFVEGVTLAEAMDVQGFSFRESAQLMAEVAEALEHAHQHGVIHRDIKPSNIMLEGFDADGDGAIESSQSSLAKESVSHSRVSPLESPRPRLMDFGLARHLEDQTSTTVEGTLLGTPAYMSPEQARGESHQVDGRTDVYSVGVILYQMLAEELPFRGKLRMLLSQILNDEPRPLRRLNDRIPRDLETIVLKCLAKQPSGRYASAAELAADLRRYLSGRPIEARPVSTLERCWRWCRRNPGLSSMIMMVLLSLVFGLSASSIGYIRVSRALEDTRMAKKESDENFQEAIGAVEDLFTRVSEDVLLNQPGMQGLRKDLLGRAKEYYSRFAERRQGDPSVRQELAMAHFRVGLITEAIESSDNALESYRTALGLQQLLCEADPEDSGSLRRLSDTLSAIGRCHSHQQRLDKARDVYDEAIEKRKVLAEQCPEDAEIQRLLASAYMNRGLIEQDRDPRAALVWLKQAQEMRRSLIDGKQASIRLRRDLAFGYFNLVQPLLATGDVSGSEDALRNAIAAFEKLHEEQPEDLSGCYHLNLSRRILADHEAAQGRAGKAGQLYKEARRGLEILCADNPAVVEYRAELARLCLNQGQLMYSLDRSKEALECANQAVAILIDLTKDNPGKSQDRLDLITASVLAAEIQRKQDKPDAALGTLKKLRDHFRELRKDAAAQDPELEQQYRQIGSLIDKLTSESSSP